MGVHDIAIIGGGPAGLYLAGLLEDAFDVIVLEKQQTIGHKVCSGLISKNIHRFVDPGDTVEHEVNGALVHSPSGTVAALKKSDGVYVIDRHAFDRMLAEKLIRAPIMGTAAESLAVSMDGVTLQTTAGPISAAVAIGCDGASSVVGKHTDQRPNETVAGVKIIVQRKDESDSVDIFFNKTISTDGFLWKIPRGNATEYGALGSRVKFDAVEHFFKTTGARSAAPIPIGPCRTFSDRMLLLGDAAGQTKPWSGGGVIFGLTAAEAAANALKACFDAEDFSTEALSAYETAWKKEIGKQIEMGLLGRAMLKDMTNSELDTLVGRVAESDMSHVDMDFPFFSLG